LSQAKEALIRNYFRDPVEHSLWRSFYPVIAEWNRRPYFKNTAYSLTLASSRFAFAAMSSAGFTTALKLWRAAQAEFIADTEYHSLGAISTKLLESGDGKGAELICEMAARRGPVIEAALRSQVNKRIELKRVLVESGLPSLLEDERYRPLTPTERLGDTPVKLQTTSQVSVFGPPRFKVTVKSLYDPEEPIDGFRLLCDHFPPRIHPKRAAPYDARVWEGLPSRHLFDWFKNDPERWAEFQHYHHRQLHGDHASMTRFLNRLRGDSLTLLHLDRGELSIAQSLREYLVEHFGEMFYSS
jgi:uncharacterized protein YeaO (DUF488 family)